MKYDGNGEKSVKPRKLKSINRAMWGYFCLFAILLIVFVEIIFFVIVSVNLESKARDRVTMVGEEMERALRFEPYAFEKELLDARREGFIAVLMTTDGRVCAPEDYDDSHNAYEEIKKILGDEAAGSSITYRSGNLICYASKMSVRNNQYYLHVTYSVMVVTQTVGSLQLYLFIVGIVLICLALLVSYIFSRRLTDGLQTLSDTAVNLAKGDYNVQFVNADYKELASLSNSLNYVRDEVKKSEDFQHEILANVTHDLKTPLTMIKAYASMIKEISGDNKEKRDKHVQVIIDEADRLTGLVNDVLSVSKIQANMSENNLKVFNLTDLVYSIINKFGYLQESQGYNFMIDIDADKYTRADEEKISQVLYNLLGNAANYTGDDKTVYISLKTSMDGSRVRFSVRDTGKGISKEELPEIWNRYYRSKENHSRPVKGTGLGLNIVKAILENHSFDFGVDSEVGKGSTFWIDFPAVPSDIQVSGN